MKIGVGLSLTLPRGASTSLAQQVAAIVSAAGGAMFVIADLSTMTVGRDGTGGAPTSGSVVGRIYDAAGSGVYAAAPSDAARPLLTVSGGLAYLTADGVDDVLRTASMAMQYAMIAWREISVPGAYNTIIGQAGRSFDIALAYDLGVGSNAILYAADYYLVNGAGPYATGTANNPIPRTTERILEVTGGSAVTGIVSLFARVNTWQGVGGRVYGFIALPTIPSASDATILRQYMASLSGVTLS